MELSNRFYEVDFDALYDIDGGKWKWSWKKFGAAIAGGFIAGVLITQGKKSKDANGNEVEKNGMVLSAVGGFVGAIVGATKYILVDTWNN